MMKAELVELTLEQGRVPTLLAATQGVFTPTHGGPPIHPDLALLATRAILSLQQAQADYLRPTQELASMYEGKPEELKEAAKKLSDEEVTVTALRVSTHELAEMGILVTTQAVYVLSQHGLIAEML